MNIIHLNYVYIYIFALKCYDNLEDIFNNAHPPILVQKFK